MCAKDVTRYWNEGNKTNASLSISHFSLDTTLLPGFPEYSLVNCVFTLVRGGFSNITGRPCFSAGYGILLDVDGKQLDKAFLTNSFSLITEVRRTTYSGRENCPTTSCSLLTAPYSFISAEGGKLTFSLNYFTCSKIDL